VKIFLFLIFTFFISKNIYADLPEMIISEEEISPGIALVFEAAIKDDVYPSAKFGSEKDSDIHIEVLANWNESAPSGAPLGGFVAYLDISVEITNQITSEMKSTKLLPHLNMSDNLHYALNIKLPGKREDIYMVKFIIEPPIDELGLHLDWREEVGDYLSQNYSFEYQNLDFMEIANSARR
jgi:uncharacterized protein involved in high-affinity Fe2+ transport